MAVMKKKGKKEVPAISTASLPDVVFMLLFFFMTVTTMREQEVIVKTELPTAKEVQKLEDKSLASYIYIGSPLGAYADKYGTAAQIQLNDKFRTARDVGDFIEVKRQSIDAVDQPRMTVCLKADKEVNMGIITDVKQELRRVRALKITYAATEPRLNK